MKRLALILLLCTPSAWSTCDERFAVYGGGWSHHIGSSQEYNETHEMLGVLCDAWSVHRFRNSSGRVAVGAGYDTMLVESQDLEISLYKGLWGGYEEIVGEPGIMPVAAGRVSVRLNEHMRLNFSSAVIVNIVHLEIRL